MESSSTDKTASVEVPPAKKPDRFCIYPWAHLEITSQGFILPCCIFQGALREADGTLLSVHEKSLEQIWNSEAMRKVRHGMVLGKGVAGCAECYRQEAAGNLSYRQRLNADWERGWLNPERKTLAALKLATVQDNFFVADRPSSFQLDTGSLCNLKCRMCCSFSSTKIEKDTVHNTWSSEWGPPEWRGEFWYRNRAFLENDLLRHPESIRSLYFVGGEPFLVKEVGDILQILIDAGVADQVEIRVQTNGTTVKSPWLKQTAQFKSVVISVSLDGHGKIYDYIRYPAHWEDVARNLLTFKQLPNVDLWVGTTLQANNMLHIVDLLRFLDSVGINTFSINTLTSPLYLSPTTMPPRARQLARERLLAYAETDCKPHNRGEVLGVVAGLEAGPDHYDPNQLRDFMLFTNDLDSTRGQDFGELDPELLAFIQETGFEWTKETRHAGSKSSLPLVQA